MSGETHNLAGQGCEPQVPPSLEQVGALQASAFPGRGLDSQGISYTLFCGALGDLTI